MESETREQKLVFCLAANCQRLKRTLNVSGIAQALIERGVVSENALQKVGRLVGQHTSLNPTLNLLRALFDALSHRNEERKHNLSVFVLAARRRNDDVISSCLPSLGKQVQRSLVRKLTWFICCLLQTSASVN